MNDLYHADFAKKSTPDSRIWGVSSLVLAIGDAISGRFNPVIVEGEISAWNTASSGHCYFTLKDESACLRCAMFKRQASLMEAYPREGERVKIRAKLDVYPARGDLQLIVESIESLGKGQWYERFLQLKERLHEQGLFDVAHKKKIPSYPQSIGLISSLGAAALQDVMVTLQRRVPHIPVKVYPCLVQGDQAPLSIIDALEAAKQPIKETQKPCDVVLLVRGGGSLEDLWAFNDEALAHALFRFPFPLFLG